MADKINFDIKIDFFKENQKPVNDVLYTDPFLKSTLDDICNFMQYMGIKKVSLKFKTDEDAKKYLDNLKTRKVKL